MGVRRGRFDESMEVAMARCGRFAVETLEDEGRVGVAGLRES